MSLYKEKIERKKVNNHSIILICPDFIHLLNSDFLFFLLEDRLLKSVSIVRFTIIDADAFLHVTTYLTYLFHGVYGGSGNIVARKLLLLLY